MTRDNMRPRTNGMLGVFLFGGEVTDKPISVLSGSERIRVTIIWMLLEPIGLPTLNELTGYLDVRTEKILK